MERKNAWDTYGEAELQELARVTVQDIYLGRKDRAGMCGSDGGYGKEGGVYLP